MTGQEKKERHTLILLHPGKPTDSVQAAAAVTTATNAHVHIHPLLVLMQAVHTPPPLSCTSWKPLSSCSTRPARCRTAAHTRDSCCCRCCCRHRSVGQHTSAPAPTNGCCGPLLLLLLLIKLGGSLPRALPAAYPPPSAPEQSWAVG